MQTRLGFRSTLGLKLELNHFLYLKQLGFIMVYMVYINPLHKPPDLEEVIENQFEPEFSLVNNGPLRQELEVSLETLNGDKFKGSIPPQEAKHAIFKSCVRFSD